jgi:hypothetical protein
MEGLDVLDGEVEVLDVGELVVQLLFVGDHGVFVGFLLVLGWFLVAVDGVFVGCPL